MAVVHRVKFNGSVHVGKYNSDGVLVFDPPLPESYYKDCEERLQDALESRSFPGLNTDTTFLANRGTLDSQFEDKNLLKATVQDSMKHGYKPKPTDVYLSGLARFRGDPEAYVGAGGDAKAHIKKICEKRGIGCRGSINIPQPDRRIDAEDAIKRDYEKSLAKRLKKAK